MSSKIEVSRELADRLTSKASCIRREAMKELRILLAAHVVERQPVETEEWVNPRPICDSISDELALEVFQKRMILKMEKSSRNGRHGWQSFTQDQLNKMLHTHLAKGDPVDVANFCMMLDALGMRTFAAPAELAELQATIDHLRNDLEGTRLLAADQLLKINRLTAENERIQRVADNYSALLMDANAEIERLKAGHGEPVYQVRTHGSDCWEDISGESLEMCKCQPEEYEVRKLYTSQPAPVSVVLPIASDFYVEVFKMYGFGPQNLCMLNGKDLERIWNACLDKVKELNQ
jgi:hypothetical protein